MWQLAALELRWALPWESVELEMELACWWELESRLLPPLTFARRS